MLEICILHDLNGIGRSQFLPPKSPQPRRRRMDLEAACWSNSFDRLRLQRLDRQVCRRGGDRRSNRRRQWLLRPDCGSDGALNYLRRRLVLSHD